MKNTRCVAVITALCLLLSLPYAVSAANQTVSIMVDGIEIAFEDAKPYYDESVQRVFVPVEEFSKALSAAVEMDTDNNKITITRGGAVLNLRIGVKTATVNGVAVSVDAAPFIENDSTYVPLRFICEYFLLDINWDSQSSIVTLKTRPQLELGMKTSDIKTLLGEPSRTALSEKGYIWWVYEQYDDYTMIGVADDIVVSLYLHSDTWQLPSGLRYGMTAVDCDALLSDRSSETFDTYTVYTGTNSIYTLFFNESREVYAILHELSEYTSSPRISVAVLEGYARQFLDLVNIERHKLSLPAIIWDETLTDVARNHSADLAKNNLYSHTASAGSTPKQRLENAGLKNFYQIEVIARAFPNALTAFSAHLNNARFRAVLRASYTSMGAGVAYNPQSDGLLYYTQVFYTAK